MATMGTRYNTYYFITDGGSTGLEQKLYATGGNTTGQQGTGSSNSTSQGIANKVGGLVKRFSSVTGVEIQRSD